MIIVERKPIAEIFEMVKLYRKIVMVGCGGCATICFAGGEKEVGILASALRIKAAKEDIELVISEAVIERQCEKEWVSQLKEKITSSDAILSLGCGAGVQMIADLFAEKEVFPALNTKFIGVPEEQGVWNEKCLACGNCILHLTGGICPITRCAKSLLNGPCGGSQNGKCEVNKEIDCGWQLIYDKLKKLNKLELLEGIIPLRDWRASHHGGVRKVVREDLRI